MAEKLSIADLSRQPLVRGTSCFTTPDGNVGFKSEDIQLSALVRIAAALEQQTELLAEPERLTAGEYGQLGALTGYFRQVCQRLAPLDPHMVTNLMRLCDLLDKLLLEGGPSGG